MIIKIPQNTRIIPQLKPTRFNRNILAMVRGSSYASYRNFDEMI